MLEGKGISKQFGDETIISNTNFSFPEKGLILITGASGSGKTTFLNILNLWIPFEGELLYFGIPLKHLTHDEKNRYRQHQVSTVYQENGLIKTISILHHIQVVKAIKGEFESAQVKDYFQHFFKEVSPFQLVGSLSRGQQQRFALMLACLGRPKIILLDEPTTGLDLNHRLELYALLQGLQRYLLVIMTTHADPCEGIPFTNHIQFPMKNTSISISRVLRQSFTPSILTVQFPFKWLWAFHYRYRKKEKYRYHFHILQSITFGIFGVFLSLIFVLSNEVTTLSRRMIGGQYQWVKMNEPFPMQLTSTHREDKIIETLTFPVSNRYIYDSLYFESLKPFHYFYIENGRSQTVLKDFHLGLINEYVSVDTVDLPPWVTNHLLDEEMILGIQPIHIRMLSQLMNTFPTIHDINQQLATTPLPIYLSIFQPHWGYEDELYFQLKGVILTEHPTWFHGHNYYAELMYETRMRLPSKGIEETFEFEPWRVAKTNLLITHQHALLVKIWKTDPRWQHYHLERVPHLGWKLYRTSVSRYPGESSTITQQDHHFHSPHGYHYYPDLRLSGFAQPIFFHSKVSGYEVFIESLQSLDEPFSWLSVPTPPQLKVGHLLVSPQEAVKYQGRLEFQSMNFQEVVLSRELRLHLQLEIGDKLLISFPRYDGDANEGILADYLTNEVRIAGERNEEGYWVYHYPGWWEEWLMIHGNFPSHSLYPEAWILYQSQELTSALEIRSPLMEVERQIAIIQRWLWLGLVAIFISIGIPSLILFSYYLQQSIIAEKKTMTLLQGFGTPLIMLYQWYATRLAVLMIEVFIPSVLTILSLDYLIKNSIEKGFYIAITYELPWIPLSILAVIFLLFYLGMVMLQNLTMKKLIPIKMN